MDIKIITQKKKIYITSDGKEFDDLEVAQVWQEHLMLNKNKQSVQETIDNFIADINKFKNFVGFFPNTIDNQ